MRDPNGYCYYKPTSLLHNFPEGVLNPVFKRCSNKSKRNPTHYHQQLEGSAPGYGLRTKLAQVYPYRFCSTLIRCILPLGNPRALYPSQLSLAVDLLEDLNLDELRGVQNQLATLTASEHPVMATDLYEQGLPVRDYYMKRLLNRINVLPSGNVYHPVQIEAQQDVSHVRQMYLSTSMFDNANIFRGSFQSLRVEYRHTHTHTAYSYFGRRRIRPSHVFLRVHPGDLSQLITSHWSAILFWNNDGSIPTDMTDDIPEQDTNIDPPPGLPPQQNNNQDDANPPEQFHTPPTSPHLPDVPMPDEPHTPHPGLPPDDDQFHTPFHSPPRPSDDTPDDEMPSPPDEPRFTTSSIITT